MATWMRLINTISSLITKYDKQVRRLIEKVIVYENKLAVEFKSGVTVNVEA